METSLRLTHEACIIKLFMAIIDQNMRSCTTLTITGLNFEYFNFTITLGIVKLNVIRLSVVAPKCVVH
jgi:hypothetical protein